MGDDVQFAVLLSALMKSEETMISAAWKATFKVFDDKDGLPIAGTLFLQLGNYTPVIWDVFLLAQFQAYQA